MASIAKSGRPSISTPVPDVEHSVSGLSAGETLAAGDACFIKSSDGLVYRAGGGGLAAPAAPALATSSSGGTVAAGLYRVKVSYINATGESLASAEAVIETTGTTSTITVTSPAAAGSGGNAATKYRVYMTADDGGTYYLQNGAGTTIGTDFTLTAPPATNTANPQTTNSSVSGSEVDGFVASDAVTGDPVTLWYGIRWNYGASLTPGTFVYLDDAVLGGLADAATGAGTVPIGRVIDATRIDLFRSY